MLYVCCTTCLLWNVYMYPAFFFVLVTDSIVGSGHGLSFQLPYEKLLNFPDCHHVHVISFSMLVWALNVSNPEAFNPFISKQATVAHALIVRECNMKIQTTCSGGCLTLFSW